jgi:hypothetical protein
MSRLGDRRLAIRSSRRRLRRDLIQISGEMMQNPRLSKKLHLLSGICFVAVAACVASSALGHGPAIAREWIGFGVFAVAAAFQFAAFFKQHRA